MSDEHVCTGACAPGFHPSTPPANEYGRAPGSLQAQADAARTPAPDHIGDSELRRLAGGCRCPWCAAGFEGWL